MLINREIEELSPVPELSEYSLETEAEPKDSPKANLDKENCMRFANYGAAIDGKVF